MCELTHGKAPNLCWEDTAILKSTAGTETAHPEPMDSATSLHCDVAELHVSQTENSNSLQPQQSFAWAFDAVVSQKQCNSIQEGSARISSWDGLPNAAERSKT